MSKTAGIYPLGQYRRYTYGMDMILRDTKRQVLDVSPKTAHLVDTLLLSVYYWKHLYEIPDFIRRSRVKKENILIGGFISYNPVPLARYARGVFVGDADHILDEIIDHGHESLYQHGGSRVPWRNIESLDCRPLDKKSMTLEIARGCQHRCAYCALPALKPYRELSAEHIERAVRGTNKKAVTLFAPNASQHSEADKISSICRKYHKQRRETDARLESMHKMVGKTPRTGLDGISERLRRSVNKPRSNDAVIHQFQKAIRAGVHNFWIYIVLDLPGETQEDWDEFSELLHRLGETPEAGKIKRFRIRPSTFQPIPFTPLEAAPVQWDKDYRQTVRDGMKIGREKQGYKIKLGVEWDFLGPESRLLQMIAVRAGEEFADIEAQLHRDKAIRVKDGKPKILDIAKVFNAIKPYGGVDHYCGIPKRKPWREAVAIE